MTDSSHLTLPERPIVVSPSLAVTLGLEEATMLSLLCDLSRILPGRANNGFNWFTLQQRHVEEFMPFWQPVDIQRICTNLRERGALLLASAPYSSSGVLKFAFNRIPNTQSSNDNTSRLNNNTAAHRQQPAFSSSMTAASSPMAAAPQPVTTAAMTPQRMNFISPAWQPDADTLALLAQHNIPEHFAREQVPEFVAYWRERNEPARAWGAKFMKQVLRQWRDFESSQNAKKSQQPMIKSWRPSEDAIEVLSLHGGISRTFIEDAIPEFVLYWREQGTTSDNWNRKFRDHVHRQWIRYQSAIEHNTDPQRIAQNWSPSQDVYDVLRLANIDIAFAESLIKEFVIYWRDSNQVHTSWNTRFLQYVKKCWANRDPQSPTTAPLSTRDLSLSDELTDRTWAI